MVAKKNPIPVIDLFAGPGGLAEGFHSAGKGKGRPGFHVGLSIEFEEFAHQTLELRAFFRSFPQGEAPKAYYDFVRGELTREELFRQFPAQAKSASEIAWRLELGSRQASPNAIRKRLGSRFKGAKNLVVIGGPPCQAYSVVGRARRKGIDDYDPDADKRQTLYIEYLQFVSEFRPAIFLMENVKGLLSATLREQSIFRRLLEDLRSPHVALKREGRKVPKEAKTPLGYKIYSLSPKRNGKGDGGEIASYVIRSEDHGVPQKRHRIFLLGIRDDLGTTDVPALKMTKAATNVRQAIAGLPRLRSELSRENDSPGAWQKIAEKYWEGIQKDAHKGASKKTKKLKNLRWPVSTGGQFSATTTKPGLSPAWFYDSKLKGVCNHEARAHMRSDLQRYLYLSEYARVHGHSPKLEKFPKRLLPDHDSVDKLAEGRMYFNDRFRVQVWGQPATTITSHIKKDGHYFVHPDPSQCRSLTVREAARIQTFPDNYFFCGPRTSQYQQVGNAVPPLLARQIGDLVAHLLSTAKLVKR